MLTNKVFKTLIQCIIIRTEFYRIDELFSRSINFDVINIWGYIDMIVTNNVNISRHKTQKLAPYHNRLVVFWGQSYVNTPQIFVLIQNKLLY